MLISWNSTSSVKNSSVTDAGAIGIICASLSAVCGAAFGRNHFPLKAVLQTISPPVESLQPPPDFPARSYRRGLRPETRRRSLGASLLRFAVYAAPGRRRFLRGAAACPVPPRLALSILPQVLRFRPRLEPARRRPPSYCLSIRQGRRRPRLL